MNRQRVLITILGSAACLMMGIGCTASSPVGANGNNGNGNGPLGVEAAVVGYWDQVDTAFQYLNSKSTYSPVADKWQFTSNGWIKGPDGVRYPTNNGDTSWFAHGNKMGTTTTGTGTPVVKYVYDYTIRDTLGTTFLLVKPGDSSNYTPVTFSEMKPIANGVLCFKQGTNKTNGIDGVRVDVVLSKVDAGVLGTWSVCDSALALVTVSPSAPTTLPWIIATTGITEDSSAVLPGAGYSGKLFADNGILGFVVDTYGGVPSPDTLYTYSYAYKDTLNGHFLFLGYNANNQAPVYTEPMLAYPSTIRVILKK